MRRRRALVYCAAAAGFTGYVWGSESVGDGEETASTAPRAAGGSPVETSTASPTETEQSGWGTGTPSIGGSLNGRPHRLADDLDLIDRSDTRWIHAFFDVRDKYEGDVGPRDDPDVDALRHAVEETGVRLVVTLQWDFLGVLGNKEPMSVPPSGSARERALFEYATELLAAIGEPVEVIVLGNEPIWEALDEDVTGSELPLASFTRDLKDHLVDRYDVGDPRYLVGAFNRLYGDHVREEYRAFYRELYDMARNDDDVDGIDLHVHYDGFQQAERMLSIAREAVPDATITVTEFSPVWRYARHKDQPISGFDGGAGFADRYGIPGDTTVTEYFEAAKDDPLSHEEMADFMEAMPWYNVNLVEDMYDLLSEYDVEVGTIGFLVEEGVRHTDWTSFWIPFEINCLFQRGLMATEDGAHPHYLDDYRRRG